jgi:4,5-DOPA dioxygenase extradiol
MKSLPAIFLGHGSPMNAIEENIFVDGFRQVAAQIPLPQAVLCISAHWESFGTQVTTSEHPETIHDFGGFPEELFQVQYPAPGSPMLAERVMELLADKKVLPDPFRGLDHGCWSVLKHLYPKADMPVVQLSLNFRLKPEEHFELAKQLAPLRKAGVLILGSGNLVHNLRLVDWRRMEPGKEPFDWAVEASEGIKKCILENDMDGLCDIRSLGQPYQLAVPTWEHYLPILYVLGMKSEGETIRFFNDEAVGGSLTMTSLIIE